MNEKAAPQQEQSSKSKLRQPAADSFDAFLIESKPKPPATSFDAFLKAQETPEPQLDNEGTAVSLQSGPRDNQVPSHCQDSQRLGRLAMADIQQDTIDCMPNFNNGLLPHMTQVALAFFFFSWTEN